MTMQFDQLSITDLAVHAGERVILDQIDIELKPGKIVAVTGPSGCGKTSLLRVIAGLDPRVSGEVRFNSHTPDDIGWPKFRRQVVFLHQRPVMLEATVEENLERPHHHHAVGGRFDQTQATARLTQAGMKEGILSQAARTLSIGEQQRISLIRALLIEPAVLLLDEPTSALDEDAKAAIEEMILQEVAKRLLAVLVVTHDRQQALRFCTEPLDLATHVVREGRSFD